MRRLALAFAVLATACSGEDKEGTAGDSGGFSGDDDDFVVTDTDTDEDADGDGFASPDDCDDDDDTVYPGASELDCDGLDNDCDEEIDEDVPPDSVERNDPEGSDLGELTGESFELSTYITPEGDQDTFVFYIEDGYFDIFGITVYVVAPPELDVAVELYWLPVDETRWELISRSDDGGQGFNEQIEHGGSGFTDDTGLYRVEITATGASCSSSYALQIDA